MSKERVGFYPGTFDPMTLGHGDMIKRATKMVERLVIGVAINLIVQLINFIIFDRLKLLCYL